MKKKSKFSFGDGILTMFTGGLWLVPVVLRNRNRNKAKVTVTSRNVSYAPPAKYRNNGYRQVSCEKKSKIVSIFTKKWYDIADSEFIIIDLETTGLEKTYDYIVEIAAIRYVNGVETDKFTTLVKPNIPIPPEATAVHKITNLMVRDAPTIEQVLPDLLRYLGNSLLVAHNANFDVGFIEVWARRLGYDPTWNYIDTVSVAKKIIPGLSDYKQHTILNAISYRQNKYHRAEDDCRGCAEIMMLAINSLSAQM